MKKERTLPSPQDPPAATSTPANDCDEGDSSPALDEQRRAAPIQGKGRKPRRSFWRAARVTWIAMVAVTAGSPGTAYAVDDEDAVIYADPTAPGFDPSDGAYGPPIDEADPQSSVPDQESLNRDPLAAAYMVMELSRRAELAEANEDHAGALKYFQALGKAVPNRALAFAKQCVHHQALGQPEAALAACRRATELEGAKLADHLTYQSLLLATAPVGMALSPSATGELDASFQHLENEGVSAPELDVSFCKFALKRNDAGRLRRCVDKLAARDPESAVTISHQFSLALLERDFPAADGILDRAHGAKLPAEALELMRRELEARQGPISIVGLGKVVGAVIVAVAAAWAFVVMWRRRRPGPVTA